MKSFGDGLALRIVPPRSQGVRLPLRGELGEVGCSAAVSGGFVGTAAPRAEIMDLVSSSLPMVFSSGVEVYDIKPKPPGRGRKGLLRGRKLSKALAKLSAISLKDNPVVLGSFTEHWKWTSSQIDGLISAGSRLHEACGATETYL